MATFSGAEWDVIVVGGGAAGYFAALSVKQHQPALRILIVEAARTVLGKVKISGGGRCNVTHACFEPAKLLTHYPRCHKKLKENFRQFGPTETVAWFAERGVPLHTEADGRMFPTTNDSRTVLECLAGTARKLGIVTRTAMPVETVARQADNTFLLTMGKGQAPLTCQKLVLATGGSPAGYRLAHSLGHELIPACPSLFTFCVDDAALSELSGVSVSMVTGTLPVEGGRPIQQQGPLLITHSGLSGPCILRLSAWGARPLQACNYHTILHVDWFPDLHADALRLKLLELKKVQAARALKNWHSEDNLIPGQIPARLWLYLLTASGLNPDQPAFVIKNKTLNILAERLKRWSFKVSGKGPFKEEFVTAGGVPLSEVDLPTYASKVCPGLYVVGELLDIDGVTGGFNFQNAWTSGFLAGKTIATQSSS